MRMEGGRGGAAVWKEKGTASSLGCSFDCSFLVVPTRPSSLPLDLLVLSHALDMLLLFAFGYEFAVGYVFIVGFGSEFAIGQYAVNFL